MPQDTDKSLDEGSPAQATPGPAPAGSMSAQQERPRRGIDPSESVTLFALVLGLVGALVGLVAGIATLPDARFGPAVLKCLIAMLAGGSAGVVTGGTLGAALGVLRGVRVPKEVER